MAATTAAGTASRCRTTTFFHLSLPKPPPYPSSPKFSPLPKQIILYSNFPLQISSQSAALISTMNRRSVSSPESAVVEEEEAGESGTPPSDDDVSLDSGSLPPLTGCKACGREEIESGCNGEGRIQGGIATVPGFGWWPIKAYRPCPAYVASGGRYRRTGQSMDEVVSGSGGRAASNRTSDGTDSSKKKGPKKLKT